MFKLFEKKTNKPDLMEYEADVFVTPVKEQITEISPLWEEVFERMDAIEAKIDLLLDNQNF
jgi:hypothetical protein